MKHLLLAVLVLTLAACKHDAESSAVKHYPLTGKVVSLNVKDRTATIDAAAMPGFMDAMTMEYPVRSKSDFDLLRAGASITAMVDVDSDGGYGLSHVKPQPAGK